MRKILPVILVAALAIAGGADAFARAGSGSKSFGSRGSRTYDRPIERSITPPAPQSAPRPGVESAPLAPPSATQSQPMYRPDAVRQAPTAAPMAPAPVQQPGFFQRNPFMAGLAGGLVGAGIGSLLFGHSPALAAASDAAPGASMIGMLLQFAVIGGAIWLLVRLFRRRQPQPVPASAPYAREASYGQPVTPAVAAPRIDKEFELTAADQEAFTDILLGVQRAWSERDAAALRRLATDEIVQWLNEDLERNDQRGVVNRVEHVSLTKGDLTESWREDGRDYATAVLSFSCVDTTVRADTGALVEGDPRRPVEYTEAWTFVRGADRRWLLSAIERE